MPQLPNCPICQLPLASTPHLLAHLALNLFRSRNDSHVSPSIPPTTTSVLFSWAADSETVTSESAVLLQLVSQVPQSPANFPTTSCGTPEDPPLSPLVVSGLIHAAG